MSRSCVVCGKKCSSKAHHYPRNKSEALIWQRSMGAFDIPVDTIQAHCCVCIKHIPKFVELVKQQAAKTAGQEKLSRSPLNVLVLPGATVSSCCSNSHILKNETNIEENLDADIIVRESCIKDPVVTFPNMDKTEVTVCPTSTQNEEKPQGNKNETEQCGDIGKQTDCTDVLLLGRSQNHSTIECSEKCKQCSQGICVPGSAIPQIPEQCFYECKARDELCEIIKQQQDRIYQLEFQVSRQNEWHSTIQHKVCELYTHFDRVNIQYQSVSQTASFDDNSNAELLSIPVEDTRHHWYAQRSPEFNISEPAIPKIDNMCKETTDTCERPG